MCIRDRSQSVGLNEAYSRFRRHSKELLDAIENPLPLSWSFFSKEILDRYALDRVNAIGVPRYQQVSSLLEGLLRALETFPEYLDVILEELKRERVVCSVQGLIQGMWNGWISTPFTCLSHLIKNQGFIQGYEMSG